MRSTPTLITRAWRTTTWSLRSCCLPMKWTSFSTTWIRRATPTMPTRPTRERVSPTAQLMVSPGPVDDWELCRLAPGTEGKEGPSFCFPDMGSTGFGTAKKSGWERWGQWPLREHLGPTGFLPISRGFLPISRWLVGGVSRLCPVGFHLCHLSLSSGLTLLIFAGH